MTLEVIEALKTLVVNEYNDELDVLATLPIPLPHLDTTNALITGTFNPENKNTSPLMFIVPNDTSFTDENASMSSVYANTNVSVFIVIGKGSASTMSADLLYKQMLRYTAAFINILRDNPNFESSVMETRIANYSYYEALGADSNKRWVEISIDIVYEELI